MDVTVREYRPEDHPAIRRILEHIGWAEQYVVAAERNADIFYHDPDHFGVYVATGEDAVIGFIYVQFHEWNQLAQIHGLAVEPALQRQGIATSLMKRAEGFARTKRARGIYVDTPTLNQKGRAFYDAVGYAFGYEMPRYYEDDLDGVTYQLFFDDSL